MCTGLVLCVVPFFSFLRRGRAPVCKRRLEPDSAIFLLLSYLSQFKSCQLTDGRLQCLLLLYLVCGAAAADLTAMCNIVCGLCFGWLVFNSLADFALGSRDLAALALWPWVCNQSFCLVGLDCWLLAASC
jgi:hypothetical protein